MHWKLWSEEDGGPDDLAGGTVRGDGEIQAGDEGEWTREGQVVPGGEQAGELRGQGSECWPRGRRCGRTWGVEEGFAAEVKPLMT